MTIHDDCFKRISDRLDLWVKDSQQLYDIADLNDHAFHDIVSTMLSRVISGSITMDITEGQLLRAMIEAVRLAYADYRRFDNG